MDDTDIERNLKELRVKAPTTLSPRVMVGIGLADGMVVRTNPAIGRVAVVFSTDRITSCELVERMGLETFVRTYSSISGRPLVELDKAPGKLDAQIDRALETGDGRKLPFNLDGLRPFETAVLHKALEIPAGEIRSYSWIAREIGKPLAHRAVGTALGHNPIPLLIPCHRVVRSDGMIGNYGMGGTKVKRALLASEGVDPDEVEAHAKKGERFVGSDTTGVYCHPTCRDARRITSEHRVTFRTARSAAEAGYRPCLRCRPEPAALAS